MNSWDRALWLAGAAPEDQLKNVVAVPADFIKHRKEVALIFTDQVPVWVARQGQKKVFAAHEKVRSSKESRKVRGGHVMKASDIQPSQMMPEKIQELADKQAAEGMSQTRSGAGAVKEDEKFRVTLELRHAVLNYCAGPEATPIYVELPPILVMYGVHCRMSNIGPDRCWLQDEEFYIGHEHVVRKAGQKIPGHLMENWLDLRDERPEYFEEIIVMQQPAATVDEIIVGWELEELGKRFPAAVLQRDLLSGALSGRAKMAAVLQHIICCWVAPGMTPVVQLTDTDFSFIFKRRLEHAKQDVVKLLKEQAIKEGREFEWKLGAVQVMQMLYNAFREYKLRAEAQQLGICGLRRNGQLCTAPLGEKIVEVTEAQFPWAGKFQQVGGHRYPESWLKDRMQHISDGVPKVPEWEEVLQNHERGSPKVHDDMKDKEVYEDFVLKKLGEIKFVPTAAGVSVDHEVQICGEMVKIPVLKLQIDDTAGLISEELLSKLTKTPAQRRAEQAEVSCIDKKKALQKAVRRNIGRGCRLRNALSKFSGELMEQIDQQLLKFTRHEVFKKLRFCVGPKQKKNFKSSKHVKKLTGKMIKKLKGAGKDCIFYIFPYNSI